MTVRLRAHPSSSLSGDVVDHQFAIRRGRNRSAEEPREWRDAQEKGEFSAHTCKLLAQFISPWMWLILSGFKYVGWSMRPGRFLAAELKSVYSRIRLAKLDPLSVRSQPRTMEFSTAVPQNAN
jgi:hypothetical protein